jgi:hypothetical protein
MTANAPQKGRRVVRCPWCLEPVSIDGGAPLGCADAQRHTRKCSVLNTPSTARTEASS